MQIMGFCLSWPISTANSTTTQLTPISASGAGATASMAGSVQPVLQNQDGTFVGTRYNDRQNLSQLISFDQSGNVKWSVTGNYQPQIATADGGVIATSDSGPTITFDQNGSATAQVASLAVNSWMGNSYSVSPAMTVISQALPKPDYATSFDALWGGNHSHNGTSVHQEWFPELPSCPLAPPGQPPCAKEVIRDALQALRAKMLGPCAGCSTYVFNKLGSNQQGFLQPAPPLLCAAQAALCLLLKRFFPDWLTTWNGLRSLREGRVVGDLEQPLDLSECAPWDGPCTALLCQRTLHHQLTPRRDS